MQELITIHRDEDRGRVVGVDINLGGVFAFVALLVVVAWAFR
ncbi:hypothetical protein [uncultured Methylobacterium sp.]